MKHMKKTTIPDILLKVIVGKYLIGLVYFVGFILLLIFAFDKPIIGILPATFALCIFVDATLTWSRCQKGNYVVITGVCTDVEVYRFRRHTKAVWLQTKQGSVKVILRYKGRNIEKGDTVEIYTPAGASVYECGRDLFVNEYYAISIAKKIP